MLDKSELKQCLQSLELELSPGDIEALMLEADHNKDGSIDYDVSLRLALLTQGLCPLIVLCLAASGIHCRVLQCVGLHSAREDAARSDERR